MRQIVDFAQEIIDMQDEILYLREEKEKYEELKKKYNDLLDSSMKHAELMQGRVLGMVLDGKIKLEKE